MVKAMVGFLLISVLSAGSGRAGETLKVLLIDGQNNHGAWSKMTPMIQQILENTGRFTVTHSRTPPDDKRKPNYGRPQPTVADMPAELQAQWAAWHPAFSEYDAVVLNYNGVLWPDAVRRDFEQYMRDGGGMVVVHAADNAFAQWEEYNRMIGVGGWYGRNEKSGPAIYWEDGKLVRDPGPGRGGAHGKRVDVLVENRAPEHPITRGLPAKWLHPADEVYYNMRGPAENITVLATAFSDAANGGSGKHQPVLMVLTYGKGRVVHELLGHDETVFRGVGIQTTLARGAEWAATGAVTLPPVSDKDLPADRVALRDPAAVAPR